MERIRLIWDFRGPDGYKTAEHHVIHLNEFIVKHQLENTTANFDRITDAHTIAFIETDKSNMITLRDALKPHRGEYVSK